MERILQLSFYNKYLSTDFKLNDIDKIMFFDEILLNLQVKVDNEKYPDSIFLFNDDICYVELSTKNYNLYCSYKYIWSIFEREFLMEYKDIQSFINGKMELY